MATRHDLPNNMPFGQKKELEDAQAIVPAVPRDQIGLADPKPGPSLNRPSEFPNESLFEGSRTGPGAGPEALLEPDPVADIDEELLIGLVPILEGIALGRHNGSSRMRQMIRKYRSQLPPEADMVDHS